MMRTTNHPLEPEELMAYLDGELSSDRATWAGEHLAKCRECQEVAAGLQVVTDRMLEWHIEAPLMVAPERTAPEVKGRWLQLWGRIPRFALGVAGVTVLMPLTLFVSSVYRAPKAMEQWYSNGVSDGTAAPPIKTRSIAQQGQQGQLARPDVDVATKTPTTPLIASTARLTLIASNFDRSRDALQEILKRHHAYIAQMTVNAEEASARSIEASIKAPAAQLDATMAEIKGLGRVLSEVRGGEEVTQQWLDLDARLANARHTEQRLTDLLQHRTDKLADIMAVENQISETRGQIEQMEAERKNLTNRVEYAKIDVRITEEYKASMGGAPTSTSTRLRNAAVVGYQMLVSGLLDVATGILSYGPQLIVWSAILFFPGRFVWRRMARR